MRLGAPSRTRAALAAAALAIVPAAVSACDSETQETNAAANQVELARYLPEDSELVQTVDVTRAREELDLPDDANALPTSNKTLPRAEGPEAKLFDTISKAYPDVIEVLGSEFNGRGASPLDGTLIRAAAGNGDTSIVSTAEPSEDVERKLELAGYSRRGKIYVAGEETPEATSKFVANAGNGRFVFADDHESVQDVLRRMRKDASPGEAAKALERATSSVRLAMTNDDKRSCVTAFAADMEATSEGAALALIISGEKPDPDRFNPKPLEGIATGTPTVLVDALLVPMRVKKPLKDGLDALQQVVSTSKGTEVKAPGRAIENVPLVLPPFKAYDCP